MRDQLGLRRAHICIATCSICRVARASTLKVQRVKHTCNNTNATQSQASCVGKHLVCNSHCWCLGTRPWHILQGSCDLSSIMHESCVAVYDLTPLLNLWAFVPLQCCPCHCAFEAIRPERSAPLIHCHMQFFHAPVEALTAGVKGAWQCIPTIAVASSLQEQADAVNRAQIVLAAPVL